MVKINSIKNKLLESLAKKYANKPIELLISNRIIRKNFIKFFDKRIHSGLLKIQGFPQKVQEDKYYMVKSIILALDKAFEGASNAPQVRKSLITFFGNILSKTKGQTKKFQEEFGENPPLFLTISPGKLCNLNCPGCYANSSSASSEKLDWDVLDRIVREKANLWGSYFTVISGGEPLLYESQGKTIIDLVKKHQDNYFLMYTNGTLINKEMAKKLAEVGNLTPAISVEGFEKETDARRGKSIHRKILEAMGNLREAGVPFGISVTATKNNADLVISDEMMDYYINNQGAIYCWIFQLMPIGRANTLDSVITPEQRVRMFRQTQHLIRDRKIFITDFWNCGSVSNGCISAGRHGGYLYIEWNGNVTPCVFNPYSPINIYDVYKKGRNLNDVLREPFLKAIRKWQNDYGLEKKPDEIGNWILPCPIRDHYPELKKLLIKHQPKPIDESAKEALEDPEYQKGMEKYDQELAKALDPIWKKEYLKKG